VQELKKREDIPSQFLGGVFQAPNGEGQCVLAIDPYGTHLHHRKTYYFDGQIWHDLPDPKPFHDHGLLQLVRVTSAFYHSGRITVYPDDATQFQADPEGEGDDVIYWHHLTFRWPVWEVHGQTRRIGYSVACLRNGHEDHPYAARDGQTWHKKLFPQGHRPTDREHRRMRANPPIGSLNGDLSLLIALLAFSADPEGEHVEETLKGCIRAGSWAEPHREEEDGCEFASCSKSSGIVLTHRRDK
jgi:hypothetical protein